MTLTIEAAPGRGTLLRRRMTVGPVHILDADRREAIDDLVAALSGAAPTRVAFANANTVTRAMREDGYARILRSFAVLPDGVGVDLAAKAVHGRPFRENLNGTDFTPALLAALPRGCRVFLLGAGPGIADAAAARWRGDYPHLDFVGTQDGYFDRSAPGLAAIAEAIRRTRADVLLVGMGNPLQEEVIASLGEASGARLLLGVGALFDFAAGRVRRAPAAIRRVRAEFLWRLACEPRRLGKRYTLDVARFAFGVWRQTQGSARPLHDARTA